MPSFLNDWSNLDNSRHYNRTYMYKSYLQTLFNSLIGLVGYHQPKLLLVHRAPVVKNLS